MTQQTAQCTAFTQCQWKVGEHRGRPRRWTLDPASNSDIAGATSEEIPLGIHLRTKFDGQRFTCLCQTHVGLSTTVNPSLTPFPDLRLLLWLLLATANCTEARLPRLCLFTVEGRKKNYTNPASRLWCGRRKTTGRDWEECWWGTNQSTLLLIRAIVSRPLCYGVKAVRCCVVANTYPQLTATTRTEDRGPVLFAAKLVRSALVSR